MTDIYVKSLLMCKFSPICIIVNLADCYSIFYDQDHNSKLHELLSLDYD